MPATRKIRVMISSRSKQPFPYGGNKQALLADVRKEIQADLEAEPMFGEQLFEVWINENAPSDAADIWDKCLEEVRRADIVIALYNGDAGWAGHAGDIGICHAELKEARNTAPGKLRVLQLDPLAPLRKGPDEVRDKLFREYMAPQQLFTGAPCADGEAVIELCKSTVREAVADMVRLGVREARKGKFYSGDALDWTRLAYQDRQARMLAVLTRCLGDRGAAGLAPDQSNRLLLQINGQQVLFLCSASPASFSIPEAREGLNQAFLRDYRLSAELTPPRIGPVHVIACHRSITETQAIRQLGFPDAVIVNAPFGVYVADNVQKVQLIFLANCRDPTTTAYQVQRLFDWIEQVGEGPLLVHRAAARARIVQAIAAEQNALARTAGG